MTPSHQYPPFTSIPIFAFFGIQQQANNINNNKQTTTTKVMTSVWIKLYIGKDDKDPGMIMVDGFSGNVYQLKKKIKDEAQLEVPALGLEVYLLDTPNK